MVWSILQGDAKEAQMRPIAAIALIALTPFTLTGCATARQKCVKAVMQEYMDADKVMQQPIDLDGFCAQWNNHPPGTPR